MYVYRNNLKSWVLAARRRQNPTSQVVSAYLVNIQLVAIYSLPDEFFIEAGKLRRDLLK